MNIEAIIDKIEISCLNDNINLETISESDMSFKTDSIGYINSIILNYSFSNTEYYWKFFESSIVSIKPYYLTPEQQAASVSVDIYSVKSFYRSLRFLFINRSQLYLFKEKIFWDQYFPFIIAPSLVHIDVDQEMMLEFINGNDKIRITLEKFKYSISYFLYHNKSPENENSRQEMEIILDKLAVYFIIGEEQYRFAYTNKGVIKNQVNFYNYQQTSDGKISKNSKIKLNVNVDFEAIDSEWHYNYINNGLLISAYIKKIILLLNKLKIREFDRDFNLFESLDVSVTIPYIKINYYNRYSNKFEFYASNLKITNQADAQIIKNKIIENNLNLEVLIEYFRLNFSTTKTPAKYKLGKSYKYVDGKTIDSEDDQFVVNDFWIDDFIFKMQNDQIGCIKVKNILSQIDIHYIYNVIFELSILYESIFNQVSDYTYYKDIFDPEDKRIYTAFKKLERDFHKVFFNPYISYEELNLQLKVKVLDPNDFESANESEMIIFITSTNSQNNTEEERDYINFNQVKIKYKYIQKRMSLFYGFERFNDFTAIDNIKLFLEPDSIDIQLNTLSVQSFFKELQHFNIIRDVINYLKFLEKQKKIIYNSMNFVPVKQSQESNTMIVRVYVNELSIKLKESPLSYHLKERLEINKFYEQFYWECYETYNFDKSTQPKHKVYSDMMEYYYDLTHGINYKVLNPTDKVDEDQRIFHVDRKNNLRYCMKPTKDSIDEEKITQLKNDYKKTEGNNVKIETNDHPFAKYYKALSNYRINTQKINNKPNIYINSIRFCMVYEHNKPFYEFVEKVGKNITNYEKHDFEIQVSDVKINFNTMKNTLNISKLQLNFKLDIIDYFKQCGNERIDLKYTKLSCDSVKFDSIEMNLFNENVHDIIDMYYNILELIKTLEDTNQLKKIYLDNFTKSMLEIDLKLNLSIKLITLTNYDTTVKYNYRVTIKEPTLYFNLSYNKIGFNLKIMKINAEEIKNKDYFLNNNVKMDDHEKLINRKLVYINDFNLVFNSVNTNSKNLTLYTIMNKTYNSIQSFSEDLALCDMNQSITMILGTDKLFETSLEEIQMKETLYKQKLSKDQLYHNYNDMSKYKQAFLTIDFDVIQRIKLFIESLVNNKYKHYYQYRQSVTDTSQDVVKNRISKVLMNIDLSLQRMIVFLERIVFNIENIQSTQSHIPNKIANFNDALNIISYYFLLNDLKFKQQIYFISNKEYEQTDSNEYDPIVSQNKINKNSTTLENFAEIFSFEEFKILWQSNTCNKAYQLLLRRYVGEVYNYIEGRDYNLLLYVENFNLAKVYKKHLSVDKFILLFTTTLMKDLDQLLLDDMVTAGLEFDITELKDKLAKISKLSEYCQESYNFLILSEKMLSFDCKETYLQLKDEDSGSMFCIIPQQLEVVVTRHTKEKSLKFARYVFGDERNIVDINAKHISGYIVKEKLENDFKGLIQPQFDQIFEEKNIISPELNLTLILYNLNIDSIIQWVKVFNCNLLKDMQSENDRISRSIRSTFKRVFKKEIHTQIKIKDVLSCFESFSSHSFKYNRSFCYSKLNDINYRSNRIIINSLDKVEVTLDEEYFASLMTLIEAFVQKKRNLQHDQFFRNYVKYDAKSEPRRQIQEHISNYNTKIYNDSFFNIEHVYVVVKQIDIHTSLKNKESSLREPFLDISCIGFSVDVDRYHTSDYTNLNVINNLVMVFFSLSIWNRKENKFMFTNMHSTPEPDESTVQSQVLKFLQFRIDSFEFNHIYINLNKRYTNSCNQLYEMMQHDNSIQFYEHTPSFVIMKSDSVWTRNMEMKLSGTEGSNVGLNIVHLFRINIGDCEMNISWNLIQNINMFMYPTKTQLQQAKQVVKHEVFKSLYKYFILNKTMLKLSLSSAEQAKSRTEVLEANEVKIRDEFLSDFDLAVKVFTGYKLILGAKFLSQVFYYMFGIYDK